MILLFCILVMCGAVLGADFSHKALTLEQSNFYRSKEAIEEGAANMEQMVWNDQVANAALNWASTCNVYHDNSGYGENLFWYSTGFGNTEADLVRKGFKAWYDEKQLWSWGAGFSSATGHYTQLVWAKTNKVGCATNICPPGQGFSQQYLMLACFYDPMGNFNNENPYVKGQVCSMCSNRQCGSINGLCPAGDSVTGGDTGGNTGGGDTGGSTGGNTGGGDTGGSTGGNTGGGNDYYYDPWNGNDYYYDPWNGNDYYYDPWNGNDYYNDPYYGGYYDSYNPYWWKRENTGRTDSKSSELESNEESEMKKKENSLDFLEKALNGIQRRRLALLDRNLKSPSSKDVLASKRFPLKQSLKSSTNKKELYRQAMHARKNALKKRRREPAAKSTGFERQRNALQKRRRGSTGSE